MRRSVRPAPAASWLIALAMAVVPALIFLRWIETPGILGDVPLIGHMRTQIDDYLSDPPGRRDRMRGVMLAASGGLCAVAGDRQLPDGGPDLLVLAFPRATFDDYYPLINQLAAKRPDFIVIQSAVLTRSTWLKRQVSFPYDHEYSLFAGTFIFRVRQALIWKAPETYPLVTADRYCGDKPLPAGAWKRQEDSLANSTEGQFEGPARDRLFRGLEILADAGIPVIVAGVPRYDASAAYGESLMSRSRSLIAGAPRPVAGITFHDFPELLPKALFQDPLHVAPSVRPRYRAWLAGEIRNTLSAP
jgi:hypothetical protein